MLPVLRDGPDREVVLPNAHGRGRLQDGDRVTRDPWGHLAGDSLDDSAGGGEGGKRNGGFLLQTCRKSVRQSPSRLSGDRLGDGELRCLSSDTGKTTLVLKRKTPPRR